MAYRYIVESRSIDYWQTGEATKWSWSASTAFPTQAEAEAEIERCKTADCPYTCALSLGPYVALRLVEWSSESPNPDPLNAGYRRCATGRRERVLGSWSRPYENVFTGNQTRRIRVGEWRDGLMGLSESLGEG